MLEFGIPAISDSPNRCWVISKTKCSHALHSSSLSLDLFFLELWEMGGGNSVTERKCQCIVGLMPSGENPTNGTFPRRLSGYTPVGVGRLCQLQQRRGGEVRPHRWISRARIPVITERRYALPRPKTPILGRPLDRRIPSPWRGQPGPPVVNTEGAGASSVERLFANYTRGKNIGADSEQVNSRFTFCSLRHAGKPRRKSGVGREDPIEDYSASDVPKALSIRVSPERRL